MCQSTGYQPLPDAMKEALETYQAYNAIKNDTDTYLHCLAEWALTGRTDEYGSRKPGKSDFGI